jgi:hypothetical protein
MKPELLVPAGNFSFDELKNAVEYCHNNGARQKCEEMAGGLFKNSKRRTA